MEKIISEVAVKLMHLHSRSNKMDVEQLNELAAQIDALSQTLDENSELLSCSELKDLMFIIFSHDWESAEAGLAVIQSITLFVDQCFTTLIGFLGRLVASEEMSAQSHSFLEQMSLSAFNFHSAYYKHNNKSSLNRDIREWMSQKEGGSKWRDTLKEGDRVDVLLKDLLNVGIGGRI